MCCAQNWQNVLLSASITSGVHLVSFRLEETVLPLCIVCLKFGLYFQIMNWLQTLCVNCCTRWLFVCCLPRSEVVHLYLFTVWVFSLTGIWIISLEFVCFRGALESSMSMKNFYSRSKISTSSFRHLDHSPSPWHSLQIFMVISTVNILTKRSAVLYRWL